MSLGVEPCIHGENDDCHKDPAIFDIAGFRL